MNLHHAFCRGAEAPDLDTAMPVDKVTITVERDGQVTSISYIGEDLAYAFNGARAARPPFTAENLGDLGWELRLGPTIQHLDANLVILNATETRLEAKT